MSDSQSREELLDRLERLEPGQCLAFACHPGVACFNACCSDLSLQLSPYDVLRLRRALDLSGREVLSRYTEVATDEQSGFPLVQLRMRDDERLSCPFVTPAGCSIYDDRPGACRTYPLGRGAGLDAEGNVVEQVVIVREPHCLGFESTSSHSRDDWMRSQGLEPYNRMNDRFMRLLAGCAARGVRLDPSRFGFVLVALYQLDALPQLLEQEGAFELLGVEEERRRAVAEDEEARLELAIEWLEQFLLAPAPTPR